MQEAIERVRGLLRRRDEDDDEETDGGTNPPITRRRRMKGERTQVVQVYLDGDSKTAIEKAAEARGLSISAWSREVLTKAAKKAARQ